MAANLERKHTLGRFDEALQELRTTVLTMASVSQRNLESAYRGFVERDSDLCSQVIARDDEVDELEKAASRIGTDLILRFTPVAGDLRRVLGSMRIATHLERMADQAVKISRRVRKINKFPEVDSTKLIEPAFRTALELASKCGQTFAEEDVQLAQTVIQQDRDLDRMRDQLIKTLTQTMEDSRSHLKTYLHLTFLVRSLERVGDHAKSICENCIFIELGTEAAEEPSAGQ
jgi:phosphate transport system protein